VFDFEPGEDAVLWRHEALKANFSRVKFRVLNGRWVTSSGSSETDAWVKVGRELKKLLDSLYVFHGDIMKDYPLIEMSERYYEE